MVRVRVRVRVGDCWFESRLLRMHSLQWYSYTPTPLFFSCCYFLRGVRSNDIAFKYITHKRIMGAGSPIVLTCSSALGRADGVGFGLWSGSGSGMVMVMV